MIEIEKRRINELREAGLGYKAISKQLSISVNTVKSYCRRTNQTGTAPKPTPKKCDNCGKPIIQNPSHKLRRFCCDRCRQLWWSSRFDEGEHKAVYKYTCPACGKRFQVYGKSKHKYCCHECYIKDRFGGRE